MPGFDVSTAIYTSTLVVLRYTQPKASCSLYSIYSIPPGPRTSSPIHEPRAAPEPREDSSQQSMYTVGDKVWNGIFGLDGNANPTR